MIQSGPWNSKLSQNSLVICLLLSVLLGVFIIHLNIYAMGKTKLVLKGGTAHIVTLYGQWYTYRDIAAKLRCSRAAVYRAIVKFMTGKGLVCHGKENKMFYLTTHFIYGYMATDIWQRTTQIV